MHVLLVDDKQYIIDALTKLLAPLNCTIVTATNGLDGLTKAQQVQFDLCIIDHLMPVMNGVQLVKNLKASKLNSDTPIIFMTTQDVSLLETLEEYQYFDAVIEKPFDLELMKNRINFLLKANTVLVSL